MNAPCPDIVQGAFRALADPTRRDIVKLLSQRDMTIGEVSDCFAMTRAAVKKHLIVLEEGRLISVQPSGRERINRLVPSQWLHMLNSGHIRQKIEQGPKLRALFVSGRKPAEIVEELYLTILSRRPTQEELKTVAEYVQSSGSRAQSSIDVTWALINSTEFLHRH